ncbi:BrnA antitoxin family protein [Pelotomaculum terephthalicicum JT]|uniref:CopG family antitoxin n=1 Tax=Pelotomaculum terephthalicicum TaxID=206393 RepID=UPI001F04076A|nr:CopG family antitoxin [Pelotomaculum terephthalicicum]MCG9966754.1 BrnA antitoxin family protein [Pelotomaculum terephthalicicum JT]
MMSNENKIPDFATLQEAREFWEKHSLVDFSKDLEVAKEVKFKRKGKLVVSIALGKEDENLLHQLAKKKGVKYSDLITLWVKEHLRES